MVHSGRGVEPVPAVCVSAYVRTDSCGSAQNRVVSVAAIRSYAGHYGSHGNAQSKSNHQTECGQAEGL